MEATIANYVENELLAVTDMCIGKYGYLLHGYTEGIASRNIECDMGAVDSQHVLYSQV